MKRLAIAITLVAAGCAAPQPPAGGPDLGKGGGAADASGAEDSGLDLAPPAVDQGLDLAPKQDQSTPDMTPPPDLAPPDLAPPVDMSDCRPPDGSACVVYPQCGCPIGQSCDILTADGRATCTASGTVADWSACSSSQRCRAGATCVHRVCTPYCATLGASADCGDGALCYQLVDGNNADIPHLRVCTRSCDPTNPQNANGYSPCGPGTNCWPDADHYAWCLGAGAGAQGADCSRDAYSCAPGFYCVASGAAASCFHMCQMGRAGDCAAPLVCRPFSPAQYAGTLQIGYCG